MQLKIKQIMINKPSHKPLISSIVGACISGIIGFVLAGPWGALGLGSIGGNLGFQIGKASLNEFEVLDSGTEEPYINELATKKELAKFEKSTFLNYILYNPKKFIGNQAKDQDDESI